jgi:hypothetical protein
MAKVIKKKNFQLKYLENFKDIRNIFWRRNARDKTFVAANSVEIFCWLSTKVVSYVHWKWEAY